MNTQNFDHRFQTKLLAAFAADPEFFRGNAEDIHLSDFSSAPVRLVFEVMREHLRKYGQHPTGVSLPDEVIRAMKFGVGPNGPDTIKTECPEAMLRTVASVLKEAVHGILNPSTKDREYFADQLRDFLYRVRLNQIRGDEMTAQEQIEQASKINEEVKRIAGGEVAGRETTGRKRVVRKKQEQPKVYGTGVWPIDIRMGMGMRRGEMGVVLASSGVGKTNMLINFAVNAALRGQRSLFMSLEVDEDRILQRMQAMMGNFKMSLMNTAEEDWPKRELDRYNYMMSDEFPNLDYVTVNHEYIDKFPKVDDIEREIRLWKRKMHDEGVPDDQSAIVLVDYSKQIDPETPDSKNQNTNQIYGRIAQRLRQIARSQNVVLWTAQQVVRKASRSEHLRDDDIADAISIRNHSDVLLGFVPVGNGSTDATSATTEETEDASTEHQFADRERQMNVDFCKLRNAGNTGMFCTVWQSASLRLWTNQSYAEKEEILHPRDYATFFTKMRPKEPAKK